MSEIPRIVLDTNIFISAFFWEGNETELIRKIEQGNANLFVSLDIIEEIENVIERPKFVEAMKKANQTHAKIMNKIVAISHIIIKSEYSVEISRDKKDDKFINCALSANADYIISGDNDLLVLEKYKQIKIIKTVDILKLI